jgi:ribosomal protein S18 acetylase RimI-like enzyme
MAMEFRYVTESEAEEASAFVHDMWVDTYAPIVLGGRRRAENIFDDWVGPEKIRRDMSRGHFFVYPMVDGKIIGLLSAGKEGDDLEISKIYISPEQRGKGYGKECLDFLLEKGAVMGCRRAFLEVNPGNTAAVRFYTSAGFRIVGRKEYEHSHTKIMARDYPSP